MAGGIDSLFITPPPRLPCLSTGDLEERVAMDSMEKRKKGNPYPQSNTSGNIHNMSVSPRNYADTSVALWGLSGFWAKFYGLKLILLYSFAPKAGSCS